MRAPKCIHVLATEPDTVDNINIKEIVSKWPLLKLC